MAAAITSGMMPSAKGLHPFFTSARKSVPREDVLPSATSQSASSVEQREERSERLEDGHEDTAPLLTVTRTSPGQNEKSITPRKKRKLNEDTPTSSDQILDQVQELDPVHRHATALSAPTAESLGTPLTDSHQSFPNHDVGETLKLNGKGAFSTPRKKKQPAEDIRFKGSTESATKRRTRTSRAHLLVRIPYGCADAESKKQLSEKIDQLLASSQIKVSKDNGLETPASSRPLRARRTDPRKPTHPFFSQGPQIQAQSKNEASTPPHDDVLGPKIRSFTTPVKKLAPVPVFQGSNDYSIPKSVANTTKLQQTRQSGMREPPWPPKYLNSRPSAEMDGMDYPLPLHPRTGKGKPVTVTDSESVLSMLTTTVALRRQDCCSFDRPAGSPLAPTRTIESASTLRDKVLSELSRSGIDFPTTESHPALHHTIAKIGQQLSAFDLGDCETNLWTQKHEPKTARNVLQPTHEMAVFRQWLVDLVVNQVEVGHQPRLDQVHGGPFYRAKSKKKRKKRKTDELDDFVVGSDEEGELASLTDPDDPKPSTQSGTVLREALTSTSRGQHMNAVLISGPHGCGKSAAVYAVAHELQYEVFEINPASRRSGKDVIDRVGNMMLNHQVRQKESESERNEVSTADALPPQKTNLNSFFVSNASDFSRSVKPKQSLHEPAKEQRQHRQQTQALVLLEEVDVLFDDDKQFWETVIDLARQSRRPIVMTCRDETAIPLDDLPLHAIFRFRSQPLELAVPYLLALAAVEGHLLSFNSLRSLYCGKSMDLRASITELQFWCQKAVGDDKGGMSWQLSRWPPGSDLDENGEVKHVASNHTYVRGMGSAGFHAHPEKTMESLAMEVLQEHHLDPLELVADEGPASYLHCELRSDIDSFWSFDTPDAYFSLRPGLDATQRVLTDQEIHDFTSTYRPLRADARPDFAQGSTSLRTWSALASLDLKVEDMPLSQFLISKILARLEAAQPDAHSAIRENKHCTTQAIEPLLDDDSKLLRTALYTDIAPYVRSIAAYDRALDAHRSALSMGDDGRPANKLRKTRAARSALEGGQRAITRRDCWFGEGTDSAAIIATAGKDWPRTEAAMFASQQSHIMASATVDESMPSEG